MKYLLLNVLLISLFSTSSFAQTPEHPWTLSLSSNAVDFYEEEFFSFKNIDKTNLVSIISKVTVGRHIYKDFSGSLSATIKAQSEVVLKDIVKIIKDYPQAKFLIEGHTDNRDFSKSNQVLSELRAASVEAYLIDNGIEGDRLTAKGVGEENPITTNRNAKGRKLNRRVEVKLMN